MSRSSARRRRGQTEPTVALAAVFGVVVGLALYAGALADAMPGERDRNLAVPALDRIHDRLAPDGRAIRPARLDGVGSAGPSGYRVNVTVLVAGDRWTAGPTPPPEADAATRRASVALAPTRIGAGTLRVEVWA